MVKYMISDMNEFSNQILQYIKTDARIKNKYNVYVTSLNTPSSTPALFLLADSLTSEDSQCVSINNYYKLYCKSNNDIKTIADKIINELLESDDSLSYEEVCEMRDFLLSHAYISIINTNNIKEKWVVRSNFSDISIYYYWVEDSDMPEMYDTRISYNDLEQYEITEEELHNAAIRNTMKDCKPILSSVYLDALNMQVTSLRVNERGMRTDGALVIAYPGIFDSIKAELQSDFYILPYSTEQIYLVPTNGRNDALEEWLNGFLALSNAEKEEKSLVLSSKVLYC